MTLPTQRRSVRDIFLMAVEHVSPEARANFLTSECGNDLSLRERVESLLQARETNAGFMQKPAVALLTGVETSRSDTSVESSIGPKVGRFLLVRKIGEGGMGVVYLAEQQEPVRRQVALKIIKAGLDTHEFVRRFEGERQALALMNHANIAKVLDGGTTDAGLPYFVMELVDGSAITGFCDTQRLTINQRLRLFIDVCNAVEHAHQQGIVHRDLKPSNILVEMQEGRPLAKIIDFGVAKLIEQQHLQNSLDTSFQQFIGTPLYMSPEQAGYEAQRIDHRSDVYSLGVILYDLLTGQKPFDPEKLRQVGQDEMRRIIREDEPPMPSLRLIRLETSLASTIAGLRGVNRAELLQLVRRELDWITMKALEKDRTRRYQSPTDLAADLQRHLSHEAVHAGPRSKIYRLRKAATKHRSMLAAFICAVVSLGAGISVSVWKASEANSAKQQSLEFQKAAEKERLELQRVGIREAYAAWERREFSETSRLLENLNQLDQKVRTLPEWQLLNQELRRNFRLLLKVEKPLHEVRIIPGTSHAAAVGGDGIVYVIDVPSGNLVRRIATSVLSLHALAISDDGRLLATGGVTDPVTDRSVPLVFDLQSGEKIAELAGQLTTIESLMFTADGRFLLCGSRYENAQVFNLATGEATTVGAHDRHRWFCRSPDGQYFVGQEYESSLWIGDAKPPFSSLSIPFEAVPVFADWIPGTNSLATFLDASGGIRMRVHDSVTNSDGKECAFIGAKDATCMVMNSARAFVTAGLINGDVFFWPFPDSMLTTATSSADQEINPEDRIHVSDHSVTSMIEWNESLLVATLGGELLTLRPPEPLLSRRQTDDKRTPNRNVVAWCPNGQSLISADDGGALWRANVLPSSTVDDRGVSTVNSDAERTELKVGDHVNISATPSPAHFVLSAAISHDNKSIAFVRDGRSVVLIQDGVERVVSSFNNEKEEMDVRACSSLQFSPNSRHLAWIDHAHIRVADIANPDIKVRQFELPNLGYCLAWSPDGNSIFAGGFFRNVVSVNVQTSDGHLAEAQTIGDSGFETGCVTVNSSGQLVSGHSDGAIRFWREDRSCRTLQAHNSPIAALTISPDGRIGVSVDAESNLAVWHANTGERIGMLYRGFENATTEASCCPKPKFTSDGKKLRLAIRTPENQLNILEWNVSIDR